MKKNGKVAALATTALLGAFSVSQVSMAGPGVGGDPGDGDWISPPTVLSGGTKGDPGVATGGALGGDPTMQGGAKGSLNDPSINGGGKPHDPDYPDPLSGGKKRDPYTITIISGYASFG